MDNTYIDDFEKKLETNLFSELQKNGLVDNRMPEMTDIESLWLNIAESYIKDGVREYQDYPIVSLGWMMYVGMAIAQLWDTQWEDLQKVSNIYQIMRDKRGFDNMDDMIREEILGLKGENYKKCEDIVKRTATSSNTMLRHEGFEPGTVMAFQAYVRCLHQMYKMGAAVQLLRMGYRTQKLN